MMSARSRWNMIVARGNRRHSLGIARSADRMANTAARSGPKRVNRACFSVSLACGKGRDREGT